jgi:hypothetical protein
MARATWIWLAALLALVSCGDPARDDAIGALGPEPGGVSPGPLHRPGQPCTLCHGGKGPGNMVFSLAGTVYRYPESKEPLANAIVRFVDAHGAKAFTGTNCAGNFYLQSTDYDPTFPVWTSVEFGGIPLEMSTPIYRDGSCASCHADPAGEESTGHIYFAPAGFALPGSDCP